MSEYIDTITKSFEQYVNAEIQDFALAHKEALSEIKLGLIYKYLLTTAAKQILMVPPLTDKVNGVDCLVKPSEQFLHLDIQKGVPTIWFMCDKGREPEAVEVFTRVTGFQGFEADGTKHVGSYQLHDGTFVGHVFMK